MKTLIFFLVGLFVIYLIPSLMVTFAYLDFSKMNVLEWEPVARFALMLLYLFWSIFIVASTFGSKRLEEK